jgi:hypothetical protein
MKKLFAIIISLVVISSCSTTKDAKSTKKDLRNEKAITDQAIVKSAVESRRYIIKLDRLFLNYGGFAELRPKVNFIIVDGERAIINTAYMGRQFDVKPIVGINVRGRAVNYAVTNNTSKGKYEIKMKVNNGRAASFTVYLTIEKNGSCSASVSSLKIDNVRYSGYLVPIVSKGNPSSEDMNLI